MEKTESERLLAESIERLRAEIEANEKLFVELKWKVAEQKSKLRKMEKLKDDTKNEEA